MLGEEFGHLGLDRLGQQGARSVAQHLGKRVGERPWLKQLDDVSIRHGVSLLCWRSGGSNTPTIRRLLPVRPSPTFAHSSRETGGPFRGEDLAIGSRGEGSDIEARLVALETLTTTDLQIEWRRLYRVTPPTRLSRDLLIRGVAYRLQEQAHGGLSLGTKRRLHTLSKGAAQRDGSAAA